MMVAPMGMPEHSGKGCAFLEEELYSVLSEPECLEEGGYVGRRRMVAIAMGKWLHLEATEQGNKFTVKMMGASFLTVKGRN